MPAPEDLSFDAATAVRETETPGVFETDVHELWTVGDKPNGGYLLALLGRAARVTGRGVDAPSWEALSSAITYVRPPDLGPATITTTLLRRSRSAAQVRAVLSQRDADIVEATCVLGDLPVQASVRYDSTPPLGAPPPEDCVRLPPRIPGGARVGVMEVTELRLDPATMPFGEAPSVDARAELRGWSRFADGREPDALSLLYSNDAIPPATFLIGSTGWVPTLQMSAYVRARPAPGWLGIKMTANLVADGMVDETCVLWDSTGQVVA
ncbi:MAG TPA: thioesterase family protein, partial [Acidimicrobiales bacterium]|nr:thioesterase family protein [Acidimicrobiales bacterium]